MQFFQDKTILFFLYINKYIFNLSMRLFYSIKNKMPLNSITRKLHNMPSNSKLLFFSMMLGCFLRKVAAYVAAVPAYTQQAEACHRPRMF